MSKGLKIAAPPPRPAIPPAVAELSGQPPAPAAPPASARGGKFDQVREGQMVQFNKRVPRSVADAFELLAIRTRRKVPELLAEAAELLQEKHGKV